MKLVRTLQEAAEAATEYGPRGRIRETEDGLFAVWSVTDEDLQVADLIARLGLKRVRQDCGPRRWASRDYMVFELGVGRYMIELRSKHIVGAKNDDVYPSLLAALEWIANDSWVLRLPSKHPPMTLEELRAAAAKLAALYADDGPA